MMDLTHYFWNLLTLSKVMSILEGRMRIDRQKRPTERKNRVNYGFGDFVFRDPKTLQPVGYAKNVRDLQHQIIKLDKG